MSYFLLFQLLAFSHTEPDSNCVQPSTKKAIRNCFETKGSRIALSLYKQCTLNERLMCSNRDVIKRVVTCLKSNSNPSTLISQDTWACTMANVSLATLDCYRAYARLRRKRKWGLFWSTDVISTGSTGKMTSTSRDNTPTKPSSPIPTMPTSSTSSTPKTTVTMPKPSSHSTTLPPTSSTGRSQPPKNITLFTRAITTSTESMIKSTLNQTLYSFPTISTAHSSFSSKLRLESSSFASNVGDSFTHDKHTDNSYFLLLKEAADELELTLKDED